MPLVPSLKRKRRREHWETVRGLAFGFLFILAALGVGAWIKGDWTVIPRGLLWIVRYIVGLEPEHH